MAQELRQQVHGKGEKAPLTADGGLRGRSRKR